MHETLYRPIPFRLIASVEAKHVNFGVDVHKKTEYAVQSTVTNVYIATVPRYEILLHEFNVSVYLYQCASQTEISSRDLTVKVLCRHSPGWTEKNHEKPESVRPVSRIRSRSVDHSTTTFGHRRK
jgi:hypothetical protein